MSLQINIESDDVWFGVVSTHILMTTNVLIGRFADLISQSYHSRGCYEVEIEVEISRSQLIWHYKWQSFFNYLHDH